MYISGFSLPASIIHTAVPTLAVLWPDMRHNLFDVFEKDVLFDIPHSFNEDLQAHLFHVIFAFAAAVAITFDLFVTFTVRDSGI